MKKAFAIIIMALQLVCIAAQSIIIPESIKPGDKVAIVTPSRACKDTDIDLAATKLTEMGFVPVVMPHAYDGQFGSFSAPDSLRANDIMAAFRDTEIKAIICARGGYGCIHLLPLLDSEVIRQNPKWLVGYSDISALHAFMNHAGVASIHGPMAKNIAHADSTDVSVNKLFSILKGVGENTIELEPNEYNNAGIATGKLVGGNLMVINGLSETPWDIMHPWNEDENIILLIEDVDEQIYAIERVLYRMHLSGILNRISGLIIGDFTEYESDKDFTIMEEMISTRLREWGYYDRELPIAFGLHAGHGDINTPVILGSEIVLTISETTTKISW